jgi:3-hydroxyacyl-CoA dehydrogenase
MERIAVLGTGTMGAGIVQLAAQSGYQVTACDTSVEALERAQVYVREGLERLVTKSAFSEARRPPTTTASTGLPTRKTWQKRKPP